MNQIARAFFRTVTVHYPLKLDIFTCSGQVVTSNFCVPGLFGGKYGVFLLQ